MKLSVHALALSIAFGSAAAAAAQQSNGEAPSPAIVIDGPEPAEQPNVMTRDPRTFKSTIRAIKLVTPFRFDGRLDDQVYSDFPGFEGMLQASPRYNEPATEKTEIWVFYDEDNIYVAAKCYDNAPAEKWIARSERRRLRSSNWASAWEACCMTMRPSSSGLNSVRLLR